MLGETGRDWDTLGDDKGDWDAQTGRYWEGLGHAGRDWGMLGDNERDRDAQTNWETLGGPRGTEMHRTGRMEGGGDGRGNGN